MKRIKEEAIIIIFSSYCESLLSAQVRIHDGDSDSEAVCDVSVFQQRKSDGTDPLCVCSSADSVFKKPGGGLFAGRQQKKRMCV